MTICIVSDSARRHIDEIHDYIARDNPLAAQRVTDRIDHYVHLITECPQIGRKTLERGTRMLVAKPYPYIVFYRYFAPSDEVRILRVLHSAQRRPGLAEEAHTFRRSIS